MTLLPVTLLSAGALGLVNFWLAVRVSRIRHPRGIDLGHGGDELLERRMRAHANFSEYAPITAVLIGVIELADGTSWPLAVLAATLVIARVLHPFGMEGWAPGRVLGTIGTWIALVGCACWAIELALFTPIPTHAVKLVLPISG